MPKYKFKCDSCSLDFMELVKYSEISEVKCDCGGDATKQFTVPTGVLARGTFGEGHL